MEVKPAMFATRVNPNLINRMSIIASLLLTSCTMQLNRTPGGGLTVTQMEVRQPGSAPRVILPGQPVAPAPPFTPGSLDGVYSGIASPLGTAGGRCLADQNVNNFRVSGSSVRWGNFRGTIDRNRGVQITHGRDWLYGEFIGTQFSGVLERTGIGGIGSRQNPGCSYRLLLQRG